MSGRACNGSEEADSPESVLDELVTRFLRVTDVLNGIDRLLVGADVPELCQRRRLSQSVYGTCKGTPPQEAEERQTHAVASQDQKVVVVAQGRLSRVGRADDKLLHLRVTERARYGQVTVHSLVRDVTTGSFDSLHLFGIAGLVVVRQPDRATSAAV